MHLVTLFPQMPQVLDRSSEGIDLHLWGQVLKGTSEKIQVVSAPKSINPFNSCFSLLFGPAGSEAPVFLACRKLASSAAPCLRIAHSGG